MPYSVRKQDNKYCVYKKDSGEKVGCTAGNKEALRKYMAALHMNENNTTMKLADLVKENAQGIEAMSTEQKKAFLEAVYKFADHANNIYRSHSIQETAKALNHMIEAANHLTLSETEDWFDKVTVSRHMKQLGEAQKIFEKTDFEKIKDIYMEIITTTNKDLEPINHIVPGDPILGVIFMYSIYFYLNNENRFFFLTRNI